jgi:hypothetical protein
MAYALEIYSVLDFVNNTDQVSNIGIMVYDFIFGSTFKFQGLLKQFSCSHIQYLCETGAPQISAQSLTRFNIDHYTFQLQGGRKWVQWAPQNPQCSDPRSGEFSVLL